jgi:GR25 family glycosyltransferase involved in LPS biosynthesis
MQKNILKLIKNYNVNRTITINDQNNEHFINTYIDHIYIINLESDIIRKKYIIRLMEKYNINFELISVPKLNDYQYKRIGNSSISLGEAGCYLSHMYCLNDAIKQNYNKIIIFEDDIILHKNFHKLFENTLQNSEYDILMLGANDFHFSKTNCKFVNNNLYKPDTKTTFLLGTHAIMYSKNAINEIFRIRLNKPTFMDNNLISLLTIFKNTFYILYPNLVLSDLSTSNINHNFWITNQLKETHFYKNCFNSAFNFHDYNFIYLKPLEFCIHIDFLKSYEENITNILNLFFKSNELELIAIVKSRLVYDFFNLEDLEFILAK